MFGFRVLFHTFGTVLLLGLTSLYLNTFPAQAYLATEPACRVDPSFQVGSEKLIPLSSPQSRYASGMKSAFDGNNGTAAIMKQGKDINDLSYLAAFLPKRMGITRIELKISPENGGSSSLKGYYFYGGLGNTMPETSAEATATANSCYVELSQSGFSADGTLRTYRHIPIQADYVVLTQSINATPLNASVYELKVWGIDLDPKQISPKPQRPSVFRGIVTDTSNPHQPLEGAKIYNVTKSLDGKSDRNELLAITDRDGQFRKENIESPVLATIRIEKDGYASTEVGINFKSGDNYREFALAKSVVVKGVVREKGNPKNVLEGVIVSDAYAGKVELTKTNKEGAYEIKSLALGQKVQLEFEKDGYKKFFDVYVIGKESEEINIELEKASNTVKGVIKDKTGKSVKNASLILKGTDGTMRAVTRENGAYEIKNIKAGFHFLQPELDRATFQPTSVSIEFKEGPPKEEKRDFTLVQQDKRVNLNVFVDEKTIHLTYGRGDDVMEATVRIHQGGASGPLVKQGVSSPANFSDLPYGKYAIIVQKEGYETATQEITIDNEPYADRSVRIAIAKKNFDCEAVASSSTKRILLCGDEAKSMAQNSKVAQIDTTIGQLKQRYLLSEVPEQIVIVSSEVENASYVAGCVNSRLCPLDVAQEGDMIFFSTQLLSILNESQVENVMTHEFGHGKHIRQGDRDVSPEFVSARNTVIGTTKEEYESFKNILTDKTYPGVGIGGHPQDGTWETYASTFFICNKHKGEFHRRLQGLPENVVTAYNTMADLVVEGASPPEKCSKGN